MYKYKDSISLLTSSFQIMKIKYEEDFDFYKGLPYVFYESRFTSYILKELEVGNKDILVNIFNFIEDMLINGDSEIQNMIDIAVIENLYFSLNNSEKFIELSKYFKKFTSKSFERFV